VNGHTRDVVGTGYHDHNWGNVYLPAAFSGWTWGRVLADEWTVIFGDLVGRGPSQEHVTPFMLAQGSQVLLATDHVSVHSREWWAGAGGGQHPFRCLQLRSTKGLSAELTLTTRRVIADIDFPAPRLLLARPRALRGAAELAFVLVQGKPFIDRMAAWLLGKGSYLRFEADYRFILPERAVEKVGQTLCEVMLLG
jgi:hypothetical protein